MSNDYKYIYSYGEGKESLIGGGGTNSYSITLDEKKVLNKITIAHGHNAFSDRACDISEGYIYGIDDNENKILLANIPYTKSSRYERIYSDVVFNYNNQEFNKYIITITASSGYYFFLYGIYFYELTTKILLFHNDQYNYFDENDNLLSFNDISMYKKYYMYYDSMNKNITKLLYPFKSVRLVQQ